MTNAFVRLSQCLDKLRASCPWNASQTFDSLRYLTIEEVYELSEAIAEYQNAPSDPESANDLKKELGDLLMHIFFYASEEKRIDITYDNDGTHLPRPGRFGPQDGGTTSGRTL